jgi:hypothetical protein
MAYSSDLVRTKDWTTEILTDADLEGQLDLIINWLMASLSASTGHDHSGAANKSKQIALAGASIGVTGTLGAANGGTGLTSIGALMDLIYPIGSVVTLGVSTNPATLYGVGTWTAITGRVIVGIDAGQTEFDTLNETGGAKTHTLDTTEIPSHTHSSGEQFIAKDGGSNNAVQQGNSYTNRYIPIGSTGGGLAHNNLQPYIVKYVWERTA